MLNNQGLQARIITGFISIGAIVLIVSLIGWATTVRLSDHINTIGENAFPSTVSLWTINEAQARVKASETSLAIGALNPEQRQKTLSEIDGAMKDIDQGFSDYEKLARDPQEDRIYQKVKTEWDKWTAAHQQYLQLYQQFQATSIINPRQVQIDLLRQNQSNAPEFAAAASAVASLNKMIDYGFGELDVAFKSSTNALQELLQYNNNLADNVRKSAKQDIATSRFWILAGLILGPLMAGVFAWYFSNTIAKPLGAKIAGVVRVAEKVSGGDLTTQVAATQEQDEVGRLTNAFRTMTENLNGLIRQVQQSGIQITTSATQIAASGKELEATMTEQVASTNQVAATARQIASTSTKLVKTMEQVESASKVTADSAGASQKDLMQMEATMRKLADSTSSISAKLGTISDKANSINSIITTITKVADQTNLLSLNAAIEAEKAGEYGTGFAVVAREIRRLADQTAVATLDIENMVKEMQSAVSTGVMEMDKFTKEVEQGVEDVRTIGTKLESIIDQVQNLTPRFEEVSGNMEGQSQSAEQISEAMVQLSEASSQSAQSLREINGAISQLNDAAQRLRQEVARFRVAK